jgi:hypothetical protein
VSPKSAGLGFSLPARRFLAIPLLFLEASSNNAHCASSERWFMDLSGVNRVVGRAFGKAMPARYQHARCQVEAANLEHF